MASQSDRRRFVSYYRVMLFLSKTIHVERMKENIDIFDFELSVEEMAQIEALDTGESLFFSHHNPKTVEWFMGIV